MPDPHSSIPSGTDQGLAIGGKGYGPDPTVVAAQNIYQFAPVNVPQAYCSIVTGSGQQFAIRTEFDAINGSPMGFEAGNLPSAVELPKSDGTVGSSAGQQPVVGTDCDGMYFSLMSLQEMVLSLALKTVDSDRAILAAADESSPISTDV